MGYKGLNPPARHRPVKTKQNQLSELLIANEQLPHRVMSHAGGVVSFANPAAVVLGCSWWASCDCFSLTSEQIIKFLLLKLYQLLSHLHILEKNPSTHFPSCFSRSQS